MKKAITKLMMKFTSKALHKASEIDEEILRELNEFDDGFSFGFYVKPDDFGVSLQKHEKLILNKKSEPEYHVFFKNWSAAYDVFTMKIPFVEGVAQHRIMSKGNIYDGMIILRIFDRLLFLILPVFVYNKVFHTKAEKKGNEKLKGFRIILRMLLPAKCN